MGSEQNILLQSNFLKQIATRIALTLGEVKFSKEVRSCVDDGFEINAIWTYSRRHLTIEYTTVKVRTPPLLFGVWRFGESYTRRETFVEIWQDKRVVLDFEDNLISFKPGNWEKELLSIHNDLPSVYIPKRKRE